MGLLDRFRRSEPVAAGGDDASWSADRLGPLHLGGCVPGPVIPFGPSAFVLASGDGHAIAAAAEVGGGGRVVALGHDGLWRAAADGDVTVRAFLERIIAWCGAGDGPVGVMGPEDAEAGARAAGCRPRILGRAGGGLGSLRTVIVRGDRLDGADAAIDALSAFVTNGGSVIVDSTPWGWLQLHDGTLRDDHGANRLVQRFGLSFADGLVEPSPRIGGYAVTGHDRNLHGLDALGSARNGRCSSTASDTLVNLADSLDRSHPFRDDLRAFAGECDPFAITPSRPLRADDAATRLAAQLWIEDWQPAGPALRLLSEHQRPTPVTAAAGRHGWISTGVHARPGEPVTVRLATPRSSAVDGAFDAGVSVRIGAQTDQLWHLAEWKRFPDVSSAEPLTGDALSLANPFGGLVYVELAAPCPVPLAFEIEGGIAAPRFVLAETTPEAWRDVRSADAPWSEIEGRRFVLTVPSWATRTLDDPSAVCAYWDEVLGRCYELAGVGERARPERYVCDVQISHGYLHAGYPVMGHDDIAGIWTDPRRLRAYDWNAAWALFHETGHNFQEDWWTFDGTVEVTCNLFSLFCAQMVHGRTDDAHPALAKARRDAASYKRRPSFETWKADPFLALDSYRDLIDAFGWDAVKAVIGSYRDPAFGPVPVDDDDARGQWAVRYSQVVGRDLSGHFDAWGIPIPADARRRCAAFR
jgi:hypothetical protein